MYSRRVGKSYCSTGLPNPRLALSPPPETGGFFAVWYYLCMCNTCGCGEFSNAHGMPTVEAANVKFETTDNLATKPVAQSPEVLAKK